MDSRTLNAAECATMISGGKAFIEFDRLLPEERYDLAAPAGGKLRRTSDLLLMGLFALDGVLYGWAQRPYHFYVHGDGSLGNLLRLADLDGAALDGDHLAESLCLLTVVQLIYRFPCARKFGIDDPAAKQLRINSWGRDYCERQALPRYPAEYRTIESTARNYLEGRRVTYETLLRTLLSATGDTSSPDVARWNQDLAIKVLA